MFAAYRTPADRWSIVAPCCRDLSGRTAAPCCRDLSGRTGVRRIAALEEPAATGGAKVIWLEERAGIDRRQFFLARKYILGIFLA